MPLLARTEHAAGPSLLGRHPDRPEEISDVLSQCAHQPADRRRREPLRGGSAQAQEGRGNQRHHRIRHRIGQRLCADAQGQGRRSRLSRQCRRRQSGPQAGAFAHAAAGRGSHHALERECRLPVPHHQHARRDGMGRADRRPDHARLRPDQGVAGKARILGQGLSEQFPQLSAMPQAASFRIAPRSSSIV